MKFALALLSICWLASCSGSSMDAQAQTSPTMLVKWSWPTTYTDGSLLPGNLIDHILIEWGTTPGGPYPNQFTSPYPGTQATVAYPGTAGSYYVIAVVVLYNGVQSPPSTEAVKTVVAIQIPSAPIVSVS
jgi:hypothetical protein